MDTETFSMCNIEKHINIFYKKYSERSDYHRTKALKRFYENKDKISIQQKSYYEKGRDRFLSQKHNSRCMQFKDLVKPYAELENRLKVMEKSIKISQ